VLVSAVEDNLTAIAGLVEAVHRGEHLTDVELPAALEEVCNLVEQQGGVAPVDLHLLRAKATTLGDRRHGAADGTHQRHCKFCRLNDGIDATLRLLDLNRIGGQGGQF
jgi:hypothetical protein